MSSSAGLYKPGSPAAAIVGPDGDKKFKLFDYFYESPRRRIREGIFSLGPEDYEFPDIEFIPKFDILFPADGSIVEDRSPVIRWESVKGAESYTLRINEKLPRKGRIKNIKLIYSEATIRSTEYRVDTPLLESGKEYSLHVAAVDSEGRTINRSKITTFKHGLRGVFWPPKTPLRPILSAVT